MQLLLTDAAPSVVVKSAVGSVDVDYVAVDAVAVDYVAVGAVAVDYVAVGNVAVFCCRVLELRGLL